MHKITHRENNFKLFRLRPASVGVSGKAIATIKAVPLVDIIEPYVPLRRAGNHFVGRCPWHESRSGRSFSVSIERNLWRCWSCNIGGDAISFVMRIESCSFLDAVTRLARRLGVAAKDGVVDHGKLALYAELRAINAHIKEILLRLEIWHANELDRLRRILRSHTIEDMPAGVYDEMRRADVKYCIVALGKEANALQFFCASPEKQEQMINEFLECGCALGDRNYFCEALLQ